MLLIGVMYTGKTILYMSYQGRTCVTMAAYLRVGSTKVTVFVVVAGGACVFFFQRRYGCLDQRFLSCEGV